MVNVRMDKLIRLCNIIFVSINNNNGKIYFPASLSSGKKIVVSRWHDVNVRLVSCWLYLPIFSFSTIFIRIGMLKCRISLRWSNHGGKREISRQTMDKHGDRILFHIIIAINFESMTAIANDTLIVNDVLIKSMVFAFHMDPFMYRFSFPLFTSFDPHSILLLMVNLKRFKQIIFTLSFGLIVV